MDETTTIDLMDYIEIIRKRKALIIIITLLFVILTGIVSFLIAPTYEAQTTVIIGKSSSSSTQKTDYNDVMMYQSLVKTYAEIAKSVKVATETADVLGSSTYNAGSIEKAVTVTPEQNTQILTIKADAKDPYAAKNIANAITDSFLTEAAKIYPDQNAQVLDKAEVPQNPVKPNKKLNIAIAFVLGIMVSMGIAFLMEYMDSTIKNEKDIEKYLGIPVLGTIPRYN